MATSAARAVARGDAVFRLERGVTGFRDRKEPELPTTDIRMFGAACYAAARGTDGTVDRIIQRTYPRNFHSAVIITHGDPNTVLCQGYYPLIAFVHDGTGSWASPGSIRGIRQRGPARSPTWASRS